MVVSETAVIYQTQRIGTVREVRVAAGQRFDAHPAAGSKSRHDTFQEARDRILFETGLGIGASGGVDVAVKSARAELLVGALRERMRIDPDAKVELLILLASMAEDDPPKEGGTP